MVQIKQVGPANAETLLEISRETFFTAFAHLNKSEDMHAYADKAFTLERINSELDNPVSEFYFAYLDDKIAGYIKLNYIDAQTEYQGDDNVEIERIYVLAEYQNRQIGLKLLQFAEDTARSKRMEQLWLGVWEHNEKAIRFYERHKFIIFSTHDFMLGNDKQTDLLMKKYLI